MVFKPFILKASVQFTDGHRAVFFQDFNIFLLTPFLQRLMPRIGGSVLISQSYELFFIELGTICSERVL